ncbi:MAG: hypothetical protein V3T72_21580 [Thermoanaerobaculia bacterium]
MRNEQIFDRRGARILTWVAGLALAATLFFMVFSDDTAGGEDSWGADSFSPSAIGHRALTQLLEPRVPVLISHHSSAAKTSPRRPLLLLEPPADFASLEQLRQMVATALEREAAVIVVLPKWTGQRSPKRRRWLGRAVPWPEEVPEKVLAAAVDGATATAPEAAATETRTVRRFEPRPGRRWRSQLAGDEAPSPVLPYPQLIGGQVSPWRPLVATGDGLLLARFEETGLYLVADPDLLNTSGLGRGDNAVLAYRFLVDHLAPDALILDETLHGYQLASSVWRALLEMPLAAFSLHLAGLAALALWAGSGRFGRPRQPPPRVPPGKRTLVDNTARLFGLREHLQHSLEQYFRLTVGRVAARLRIAAGGDVHRQVSTLARLGSVRGVDTDLDKLGRAVFRSSAGAGDPRRVLVLTRTMFRWRKEILDGDVGRPPTR